MGRDDQRGADQLRDIEIIRGWNSNAEGSALIIWGNTKVLCNATVEEKVPIFMKDSGKGWVTAEYSMLPRAGDRRNMREAVSGKQGGRTQEIQRLIGRSLRGIVNLALLDGFTITLDCDVLQADGGTRTASITGGFIALYDACKGMMKKGLIKKFPVKEHIAGVSAGIVNGTAVLDLHYLEDSMAEVDMNVIMTEKGQLIEIQGTGEGDCFSREQMLEMLDLCTVGINKLVQIQKKVLSLPLGNKP